MALVTCDSVGQGLIAWLNNASTAEKDALCAALDCGGSSLPAYTSPADNGKVLTIDGTGNLVWQTPASGGLATVTSTDSSSVDFSGNGTAGTPLTASVKVSGAANNALAQTAGGLAVDNASLTFSTATNDLTFTDNTGAANAVDLSSLKELPAFTSPADDGKVLMIDGVTNQPVWDDPVCSVVTTTSATLTAADTGKLW